jgi:Domain of Unknown Function (DUF928)
MRVTGRSRLSLALWVALAGQLGLAGSGALAQTAGTSPQPTQSGTGAGLSTLVYVPHDFDAPEVTQSGGVRSASQGGLPELMVLAPPKLARTFSSQPTLYWYLSGPTNAPVRLTVLDLDATTGEPLLEIGLGPVSSGGVHASSLAEHGVALEEGRLYEWSVALEVDPQAYSEEPVSMSILKAEKDDPGLIADLEQAPMLVRAEALAKAGYWYDLIDLLSREIESGRDPDTWRALRAALLDQVGLEVVAAYDREAAGVQ